MRGGQKSISVDKPDSILSSTSKPVPNLGKMVLQFRSVFLGASLSEQR